MFDLDHVAPGHRGDIPQVDMLDFIALEWPYTNLQPKYLAQTERESRIFVLPFRA